MKTLKYMLSTEDGRALWSAKRDGWQVKTRHLFSHRVLDKEYHSAETGAKLGRATCRVCGAAISKGAPRFMLIGDPLDNGWTAQRWYVHAEPCA